MAESRVQARLHQALRAAFGSEQAEAIVPLVGGASTAFPFRVERGGATYVVRLEGERSPLRNPHQYASMAIAAEAGIAPRLYYADEEEGVAVMDFVQTVPLRDFPDGPQARAAAVGRLLHRLQAAPAFPRFVDYPDMVGGLWAWVCSTGLFAPGVLDAATARLAEVSAAFQAGASRLVASHNDLNASNLLYDGRRLWMIDWESAYANDPLIDLAAALDSFAPDADCAAALMGAAAFAADPERLALAQALMRLYYAGVLLSDSHARQGAIEDRNLSPPSTEDVRIMIRSGTLTPDMPQARHILGKIYLRAFMTGEKPPPIVA